MPRAVGARRAGARRSARGGPPRRKAETVEFADHGIAGDADFSGDPAARKAAAGEVAELLKALRSPGCHGHNRVPSKHGGRPWPLTGARPSYRLLERARRRPRRAAQVPRPCTLGIFGPGPLSGPP